MATPTLRSYLSSLVQNAQNSEIEASSKSRFLPYNLYLESQHNDFYEYQSNNSQLIYCFSGSCELKNESNDFNLNSGNIAIIEGNLKYAIRIIDEQAIIVKFKFTNEFLWKNLIGKIAINTNNEQRLSTLFLDELEKTGIFLFITTSVMWGSQNLNNVIQDYFNQADFSGAIALELFKIIILRNLREQNYKFSERKEKAFKDETLDQYIDKHYNNVSLAQAAEYFGFNRNYFSTMVKEKTGKSFVEHVDDRRMREARRLLAQPNVSLKEIIETIGYSSKSFFYKKFKHYYGMTPAEMRKRLFREAHINLK